MRQTIGYILTAFLLLLSVACAKVDYTPPPECSDAESLILEVVPNPKLAGDTLIVANVAALESLDGYQTEDAVNVIDTIESAVNAEGATYAEAVAYAVKKIRSANAAAGVAVFLLSDYAPKLDTPLPITECDKALIRLHLQKQRTVLALYAAGEG